MSCEKGNSDTLLNDVRVYVFGSIVESKFHPMLSDIDVLIISKDVPDEHEKRAKIKAEILKNVGPMNPFEIHLANPNEFKWYKRFIDKYVEIS